MIEPKIAAVAARKLDRLFMAPLHLASTATRVAKANAPTEALGGLRGRRLA
jgi:hypothetical protein